MSKSKENDETIEKSKEKDETIKKVVSAFVFDGLGFENIEKIGTFPLIINLKNAIKQENEEDKNKFYMILKNQHPQLYEFILKHEEKFENFYKMDNDALLSLKKSIDENKL